MATLNAILDLANKANNDEIYCVTSELAAIEWDDNVDRVLQEIKEDLLKTEMYHALAAATINTILLCRCRPNSCPICTQFSPFDFNSLTLYHITSFLCGLVGPCASITFVFVVIYKVMDAFVLSS